MKVAIAMGLLPFVFAPVLAADAPPARKEPPGYPRARKTSEKK
jgi:hypothetical protein